MPWVRVVSQNAVGKTCIRCARSTTINVVGLARRFEWPRSHLNLPAPWPVDPLSAKVESGVKVIRVEPAQRFFRPVPRLPEDLEVRPYFVEHSEQYSDTQYVSVFAKGSVWGYAHGAVFTQLGEFVPTFARDPWGPALHEVWRRPFLPAPRRLSGRALYLVTPEASDNYHHWMMDLLPRIGLVERAGFDLKTFDHIIINHANRRFQLETLKILGIDLKKVIQLNASERVQPDELVVPSLKLDNQEVPLNQLQWVRDRFLLSTPSSKPRRRLYLSRADAGARRLLNESEIFGILKDYGFESVSMNNLSVPEQARLFSEAEIIAGPSGAAFTNLVFCSPGTQVIEFASPRWLTVYHWMISSRIGLDHTIVVGDGAAPEKKLKINGRSADLTMDAQKVRRILKKMGLRG